MDVQFKERMSYMRSMNSTFSSNFQDNSIILGTHDTQNKYRNITRLLDVEMAVTNDFRPAGRGISRSYIKMSTKPRYDFDLRKMKWNFFNEGVEFGYRYQRDTINKSYIHRMKGQYNRNGLRNLSSMN